MKTLGKLVLALALLTQGLWAVNSCSSIESVQKKSGAAVAFTTVRVCQANSNAPTYPCSPVANIWQDYAETQPITQPGFASDINGNFRFCAPAGLYDVQTVIGGTVTSWKNYILPVFTTNASGITGSGTTNYYPLWSGPTILGNGSLQESGGTVITAEPFTSSSRVTGKLMNPGLVTISQLSGLSAVSGDWIWISNGANATDCIGGGGSTLVPCRYNGSSWSAMGGGSGSGIVDVGVTGHPAYYPASSAEVASDANLAHVSNTFQVFDSSGINANKGVFAGAQSHHIITTVPNKASGGTAKFMAAKLDTSSGTTAVEVTGGDTAATVYIEGDTETSAGSTVCTYGTTGNACLIDVGEATWTAEAAGGITTGHYVGVSSTTGGAAHDLGTGAPATHCVGQAESSAAANGTFQVLLGACHDPAGTGTMTSSGYASGSPLAKFNNSATVVSPTDLTGDATTSGGSAATVVQARGGKVAWDTNGNQTKLGNNTLVGLGVPGLVYDTVVASTNTDVGNTTMVASVPTGGAIYRFTLDVQQVDAGTGCTGTWLLAPQISYTDGYSSTVFSSSGWSGHTLNGNLWGASYTLSTSTLTANNVGNWTWMFSAAQATSISFNVVMTAGTGCSKGSTAMHYVIVPILEQLNNPGT